MTSAMQLYPHLMFNGHCQAAFQLYERCLGGKITLLMMYGDSPMREQTPLAQHDWIVHATFQVGDQMFSGSDSTPGRYRPPQGFAIQLNLSDATEAERIFHELAEEGQIRMPLQETFWARRFGLAVDRFGIPWMVNCEKALQNCTQELEETPALAG